MKLISVRWKPGSVASIVGALKLRRVPRALSSAAERFLRYEQNFGDVSRGAEVMPDPEPDSAGKSGASYSTEIAR